MKDYPYWWDTVAPAAAPATPAPEVEGGRFDVAIVGAGYTGLAAARSLARAGARVVVLDREHAGWGASSRNGGQILTGLKIEPDALVARLGEAGAARIWAQSIEAIGALETLIADESIACDYARTGHLQAACRPSHFAAFRAEQALLARVFEHRVELVPAGDQRSEIGTGAYHGLMVDERSGGLNPARLVAGLADAARRAGAVIRARAGVDRLMRRSDGWTVVTGGRTVEARDVLVAANGYVDRAAPWLQRRIVPIGSYAIATEPLPSAVAAALLPRRRMAFDSKHFLHYCRLTTDSRLLFGGRAEFTAPSPGTTRRCAAILARDMRAIFPELSDVRVEYAWSGNVAFTRDELPHAGRADGLWFAGGYSGHGVAMSVYLGALIARRIAGETFTHPLVDAPWPAIPFYRGTPWFLPIVGAYYRVRDWMG